MAVNRQRTTRWPTVLDVGIELDGDTLDQAIARLTEWKKTYPGAILDWGYDEYGDTQSLRLICPRAETDKEMTDRIAEEERLEERKAALRVKRQNLRG